MFAETGKLRIRPAAGRQVKIAIAGDTCPHKSAESSLLEGKAAGVLSSTRCRFTGS